MFVLFGPSLCEMEAKDIEIRNQTHTNKQPHKFRSKTREKIKDLFHIIIQHTLHTARMQEISMGNTFARCIHNLLRQNLLLRT